MNVSKTLNKGNLKTQIGTPYYMSPEIWNNRPYDSSSDIWSLGCLIYELCSLQPPFTGDSFPALKRAVTNGRYSPIPTKYSSAMTRAIANMLRLNPQSRLSADDMLRSPELVPKLYLDGNDDESDAILISHRENFPNLLQTIKVPQNLRKLNGALPKPCYPDVRPNTPTSWVLSEQYKKANEENSQPPPPPHHQNHNHRSRDSNHDDDTTSVGTVDQESHSVDPRQEKERRSKEKQKGHPPIPRAQSQADVPPHSKIIQQQQAAAVGVAGGGGVKLTRQSSAPVAVPPSVPAPPEGAPSNRGRPVPGGGGAYMKQGKPTRLW